MNTQFIIQTYNYLRDSINFGKRVTKIAENKDGTITITYQETN